MNSILLQAASGKYTQMLDITEQQHQEYCQQHGIAYRVRREPVQAERAPHWDKIVLILEALEEGYEYIAWLDADTLIVDQERDLREANCQKDSIGMVFHPTGAGTAAFDLPQHFNTGAMYIQSGPLVERFLRRVWDEGPCAYDPSQWEEQLRLNIAFLQAPEIVCTRVGDEWNSTYGVNETPACVVAAWHGLRLCAIPLMRLRVQGVPLLSRDGQVR